jgi:hypothetical protein
VELEIAVADRFPDGRVEPHFKTLALSVPHEDIDKMRAAGFTLRHEWKPVPGATSLRVAVRDMHTDQWGSVDIALNNL